MIKFCVTSHYIHSVLQMINCDNALCWYCGLCDSSIKAFIKVYLVTMLPFKWVDAHKKPQTSPAGQPATLSRCHDRNGPVDLIMFLWLQECCIQLYCSVDSMQESWPDGCISVYRLHRQTEETELRVFGMLLCYYSSALGAFKECWRAGNGMKGGSVAVTLFLVLIPSSFLLW